MRKQRLIVVAEVATLFLGTALLIGCTEGGGAQQEQPQAKPASALMRGMDADRAPDWRDEPAPPQFESPPPEQFQ